MYCSNCGNPIPGKLNFCSACGTPTERSAGLPDLTTPRLFIIGGTVIAVVGLMVLMPLLKILLNSRLDSPAVGILVFSYLVCVLLLFTGMIGMGWRQLSGGRRHKAKRTDEAEEGYRRPTSFRDVNTSQLPAGDPGFGSVTDSTTRTLDEVLVERK